jgi:uncharacterized protein
MRHPTIAVFTLAACLIAGPAPAQSPPAPSAATPPAENLAAARELVEAAHSTDSAKQALPIIMENLKKAIVQNRPEVEKKYDELMPLFTQAAQLRMNELTNAIANIYASNFSAAELHDITNFYRSPTGQKFRERLPIILQQSMTAGQQLGRSIANDIQHISGPL